MNASVPPAQPRPTREEAEAAVRVLLAWTGDDPEREGLIDTPARVVSAYEEYFSGYKEDPRAIMSRTFSEVEGYEDIVLLKAMRFESHCEHHIAPIIGKAHIAYLPEKRVVGISKIARLLDIYAKRLQTQETMTRMIASVIDDCLKPRGVAVIIDAEHQCMSTRGVYKPGTTTVTSELRGLFATDDSMRQRFHQLISM